MADISEAMTHPVQERQPDANGSARALPYDIVAFGGSAGAIPALIEILALLPKTFPIPILVVQHLSRLTTNSALPAVLGYKTRLTIKWAEHGERPSAGTVHVAPCDRHLTVAPDGLLELSSSAPVNRCRPAVDPLFQSIARVFGTRAVGIVLSGMMDDGARGIRAVRRCGGLTMAQNEFTSVHFDMPRAAIDWGGTEIRFSPDKIAEALRALPGSAERDLSWSSRDELTVPAFAAVARYNLCDDQT
jgi:two-component system chemotaxis response regulator CheB